ncbi:conjugal transfer protein TraG N-terminal domain-containing protein [Noviherbaspirillum sp. CPCC 100848]|uniref:Conjugal transfer protein TraG N-terminal domain-containing protein n=1 Tax=Noviherbaspirillum album TaxID=3080276 RepID=A0ABU6J4R6_9BURK|nr:conjugal transfer protein TraG N-terminal domain-containing protein [Noviherbaspirillum sp. CPCC 100848]MEC4718214.1 conjugal transfer protein TraG N-terminal domain-containing protein [Noviherbaspirillum sp. CPCC 100848]
MAVTVYSLGDLEIIRAGLTAVAMLFDSGNTDLFTGAGAAGLGHAAGFGLMVSVGWIAMKVIVGQPFAPGHLLAVMLAYIIMFVPKVTMNIEDIYTGQVAVVDGVPLGVALPGGVISGVSRSITLKIDQALRTADAETSTLSENGMVSPLKLMLAARGAALVDEAFTLSMSRYISECTDGIPPNAASSAASPFLFLQNPFQNYLTAIYPFGSSPSSANQWTTPEFVTCTDAANKLDTKLREIISGPDFDEYLTQRMGVNRPAGTMGGRWTANDLQVYINNFATAGTDAQNVMAQLATSDIIADTYRCGALDKADAISCSAAMRSAVEGAKFDSAGRGSVFARTMIPSMNVFMFLFFAISPLIAVVIAVSGMHGVTKVMPNYLLFGVWTQSWLPMAAIINHFILRQSKEAAERGLITADGLPLRSGVEFYDLLSTKIAAASDLLASTPIVTFAIISGSVMGLAQLASKAGDSFSEKNVAPDVNKVDSAASVAARHAEAPRTTNSGMTLNRGVGGTGYGGSSDPLALSMSSDSMRTLAAGEQYAAESLQTQSQQLSQALYQGYGAKVAGSSSSSHGKFGSADFTQLHGQSRTIADSLNQAIKSANNDSTVKSLGLNTNQLTNAATGAYLDAANREEKAEGRGAAAKHAVRGAVLAAFKTMGNLAPTAALQEQAVKSFENAISQQLASTATQTDDWAAKFSSGERSSAENSFLSEVSKSSDKKLGETLSQTNAQSRKRAQTAQQLDSFAKSLKSGVNLAGGDLANMAANGSGKLGERLADLRRENGISEQTAYDTAQKATNGKFTGDGTPGDNARNRALGTAYGTMLMLGQSHKAEIANAALSELQMTNAVGSIKSGSQVAGAVDDQASAAPTGLSQNTAGRIAAMKPQAEQAAANAAGETQGVNGQLRSRQGAASQGVTAETFKGYSGKVDEAAAASGVQAANNNRVTAATPGEQFKARAAALERDYAENSTIAGMASDFAKEVANDGVLLGISATAGVAAAHATLGDISSAYERQKGAGSGGPTTGGQPTGGNPSGGNSPGSGGSRTGGGQGGVSQGQYTQKVLGKVADKMPAVAAVVGARHAAATAIGAVGLAPGAAVANTVAATVDMVTLGTALYDAIKEVDNEIASGK